MKYIAEFIPLLCVTAIILAEIICKVDTDILLATLMVLLLISHYLGDWL